MSTAVRFAALVAVATLLLAPTAGSAAEVKVTLNPQNNSGESGSATLTDSGDGKTKVSVQVNGQTGGPQPMHIHKGTCAQLDPAPAYGLPALTDGKSEATVNVSLGDLQKADYAINGHKSPQEAATYVFCGEIPKQ